MGGEPLDGARELGRLDDSYRSSERYLGDCHREPSEIFAADSDDAVLCVILPQSVVGPPEDALDLGVRHVDDEGRSVIAGRAADRSRDELGGVSTGNRSGRETSADGSRRLDAVESERSPVATISVPRDEIPATPGCDELMRLDVPPAALFPGSPIVEPHMLVVATCCGEYAQRLRMDDVVVDRPPQEATLECSADTRRRSR